MGKGPACGASSSPCPACVEVGLDQKSSTTYVPKTWLKQEHLYLPALRGKLVAVSYVTDKGEKLAKAIEVLEAKRQRFGRTQPETGVMDK